MTQDVFQDTFNRIIFYAATYIAGFILMMLLNLIRSKAYGISRLRAAVYNCITFCSGLAGALLAGKVYNILFYLKGTETDIRIELMGAVILTAVLLPVAVNVEKLILKRRNAAKTVSFRDTMDLMIPGAFLLFACVKIGCFIRGCCFGVECSWGVVSPYLQKTVFPVQIFESITILIIVVLCFFIKQAGFYRRGMAGPAAAWMYGAARFGWEFLRYNTPETRNFALGLTLWQFFCLVLLTVTSVWIAVLFKTQPPEPMRGSSLLRTADHSPANQKKQQGKAAANNAGRTVQQAKRKKKTGGKKRR